MMKSLKCLLGTFMLLVAANSVVAAQAFWQQTALDSVYVSALAINSNGYIFAGSSNNKLLLLR